MLDRLDDTIVAISSAAGPAAMGIVRLSGPQAISIAAQMIAVPIGSRPLSERPGGTHLLAELQLDGQPGARLPVRVLLFRGPASYTGQDLIELQTVGSPPLLHLVAEQAVSLGAVAALAGEYTARAFLGGKLLLTEAEAVAGVIRAESDTQLRAARRMMDGTLTTRTRVVRDDLAELLGLVEADIDFAEEPIEFITPDALQRRVETLAKSLQDLQAQAVAVERAEHLPHVLLIGPPNAGKSTLMNALSGTSRAIAAAVAGTTRDRLSAPMRLAQGEAMLLDSAGVDHSVDEIIAQARELTLAAAEQVDLLAVVVDVNDLPSPGFWRHLAELDLPPLMLIGNKKDLHAGGDDLATHLRDRLKTRAGAVFSGSADQPVVALSALTGAGMEACRAEMGRLLRQATTTVSSEAVVMSDRQRQAIQAAIEAMQRTAAICAASGEILDSAEMLAFELREAVEALGEVTGEVTTEDLLGQIFANFCIGK